MFGRRSPRTAKKKAADSEDKQPDSVEADANALDRAIEVSLPIIMQRYETVVAQRMPRRDLASEIRVLAMENLTKEGIDLNRLEQRELVTRLINTVLSDTQQNAAQEDTPRTAEPAPADEAAPSETASPPLTSVPEPVKEDGSEPVSQPAVNLDPQPVEDQSAAVADIPQAEIPPAAEPAPDFVAETVSPTEPAGEAPPAEMSDPEQANALVESEKVATALDELGAGLDDFNQKLVEQAAAFVATPIDEAKARVQPVLLERIDIAAATEMSRSDLARQVTEIVSEILFEERLRLNLAEQRDLVTMLINDMLGLGPLEPLLGDEAVTDIMVNGASQVYVEKKGKL